MPGNGTTITGGGGEQGSGYWIGDKYILTAGHVYYQWTNFGHFPATFSGGSLTMVLDYRSYINAYQSTINGFQGSWPLLKSNG